MRSRASLLLSVFLGGAVSAGGADDEVRFLEDRGHIAILEHDGSSYDRDAPDGSLNAGPRQMLARELIRTHGDFYDFIVVFTNFEFDRGGAIALFTGVRNDVAGIGLPVVDNGDGFGSPKRLQGFIDMGPVSQYQREPFSLEPADPDFRRTLGVLAHEVGHRWLAGARFLEDGILRDDLLGSDGAHWSFLLSTGASFLYGNDWEAIGGNRYRSVSVQGRFSELDLYLMGFLSPEEVSPMTLLVNSDVDPARLPELSAEVEAASVKTVTVDQIIAAEGARAPSHNESQKDFTVAFVFLTAPSLLPTEGDLAAVERVRSNFMDAFFSLTRGRALADPDLKHVTAPAPGAEPDAFRALDWLLTRQQTDGRFESHPRTAVRDTAAAVMALATMGARGEPVDRARAYLTLQNPPSTDYLARALSAGAALDGNLLLSMKNADGGFGTAPGYRSDPLDTSLALQALGPQQDLAEALVSMQLPGGSWSSIRGGPGDVMTTSEAALALELAGGHAGAVQTALAWLVARQQPDGGFGDGPSAPYATALALEVLLQGSAPATSAERAVTYLRETQSSGGSWNESVFETSAVLRALVPSAFANLVLSPSDIRVEPDPPEVSEIAGVEVTVRNRSRIGAGPFDVQLFDGDPEAGGVAIGAPVSISGLGGGASTVATFSWDTAGLEGPHTLVAVADFSGALSEVSKEDNAAALDVDVLPPLPNLVSQLSALPARPIVGSPTALSARVENRGSLASPPASIRFFRETPRLGIVLGEAEGPALAPGAFADVSVVWDSAGPVGTHRVHAVVDPENEIRERRETDNEASLSLDVRPPPPAQPDLEIVSFVLSPAELQRLPQNVVATARIANSGLDPVPAARAEVFLGNPGEGGVLLVSESPAVAGDSFADVTFDLEVQTGGTRTYFLRVDAGPTEERDLSNNLASAVLRDRMDTIDVALVPGSVSLSSPSLGPGEVLEVEAVVRNAGTRPLSSAAVGLFYEVAPGGGFRSASLVNVSLQPGESKVLKLTWRANRSGVVPLEVRADPVNVLAEGNEDDNVLGVAVEVTPSTLPNLIVASTEVGASPAPLVEGQAASLEARVRNLGDSAASGFAVRFLASGVEIGVAGVSGLGPREDTVVSVLWDPVHGRGDTSVFVEVDALSAVEEIDELDNEVFRVFDIVGLPDLVATSAQIRLTPAFARSGETVAIEAAFGNSGEQPAAPFRAELRLDDPEGGALIGFAELEALPPGETRTLAASWDTTGIEGEHALYLLLDPGGDVLEAREDNNAARVLLAFQDADVFVTPVYFSPNGDGVQDEAAFFFRLSAAGEVRVEVRDLEESVVRELPASGGNGSVVWDGRNARGVLAPDGEYALVLIADGSETERRRVVLDTNRSRIVEALGTDLVSFTQLTCPLPARLDGPAWLPDDAAAYVIVQVKDAVNAPDFPVGLYRVSADGSSIELIAADVSFGETTFIDSVGDFSAQRLRAVAPGGERALVRSFSEGIQVLDLATGARTPLGYGYLATAAWTSNGRIVAASPAGVVLHDRDGNVVRTLASEGAELALASPDGLRVVYRRLGETVLRIVNADGTGDRPLEATGALGLFDFEVVPADLFVDELYFLGDEGDFVFGWFANNQEQGAGPFLADPDADEIEPIEFARELSSDQRFELTLAGSFHAAKRFRGRETRPVLPSNQGSGLHWSYRDVHLTYRASGGDGCAGQDIWAIRSLLNGEADFRLTRLPSRFGIKIAGTASDRNLESHRLEFAPISTPQAFSLVEPPSATPVVAGTFTTWIPPAPGDYLVRLTVRDKAGNVTRRLDRIFWDETPPIASLRRAPAYFSPNEGELIVSYDVLAPANLVFEIRDGEGRAVRTLPRDEGAPGPASFSWDGTGDLGLPLEDGSYVLSVEGAEFPIFLDATAPVVDARFSPLYTDGEEKNKERLAVDLEGDVRDPNLDRWELVTLLGETIASAQREVEDSLLLESGHPMPGLELRAFDRAGNRTVLPLAGPSREVRVLKASGNTVGPTKPGPADPVDPEILPPGSSIGLRAGASFSGALRFRYREEGEAAFTDILTSEDVLLRTEDLVLGRRYLGNFESDGAVSQEVAFTVGPEAIFLRADSGGLPPLVRVVLTSTIGEPIVEARLLRISSTAADVVKLYRPMPSEDEIFEPVPPCGTFRSYRIEATGASGALYRSTTERAYPAPAAAGVQGRECLSVNDAGIESQARPEDPPPRDAFAFVNDELFSEPVDLALLLDGAEVGRALAAEGDSTISFDVSAVPEGEHMLRARAHRASGEIVEGDFGLSFILDQSPPEASFVSPPEGGNVCVVTEGGRDFIALDVLARDRRIEDLWVEIQRPDGSFERLSAIDSIAFPVSAELSQRIRVLVPEDLEGGATLRLVAKGARILAESAGLKSPIQPPRWPIDHNNGGLLGTAIRRVVLSRTLGLGPLSAEPSLFSPNEDGFVDETRILGEAHEAVSLTVNVFTVSARHEVRTITSGQSQGAGLFEIVWDGKDNDGLAVADGKYVVEVEALNGCGGASTAEVGVEVDTTAPTVRIENLADSQPIAIGVEVVGTAADVHFDHYVLEFGEGAAPLSFTEVAPPVARQVQSKVLGNWSVGELAPGPYTLRLSAVDIVGNRDSTRVVLEVQASDFIAGHRAVPAVFKDTTELQFDLEAEARVTLQIRSADETVVSTILDGVVLPEGSHGPIWDGQGTQDGDYVVFLRAESPLASSLFEESRISVALDTVAPSIDIASPQPDGFLRLPAPISGSVADVHLERYVIEAGPLAGAFTEVASDSLPAAGVLATLRALGDGDYRLRATAIDQAENETIVDLTFHADSTKPRLSLSTPATGSFFSRPPATVPVQGAIDEAHLERFDLELGYGDPPSVFVPLAGGAEGPVAAFWDLEALPDGPYTLRLSAVDRALNFAEVEREVTLDATPPFVALETPSQGSVRGTLTDANFEEGTLLVAPAARPAQLTELASFSSPVSSGILKDALALENGDYILELRARDRAGNVASATTSFTMDSEPPEAPVDLAASSRGPDVTLAWTASPSADVTGYHVSREGIRLTTVPLAGSTFFDPGLSEGRYRYTVAAVDRAGLESELAGPAAVNVDLTPPVVVLRSPDEGDRVRVHVEVLGTAFAENDFLEYRVSVASAGTPQSPVLLARSPVPASFATLAEWQPLADGDYILTLEAEDTNGNVAADSVRVTVDNLAPGAPLLVRAENSSDPSDVEIEWQNSSDPDAEGYLVFRNGRIANAPGNVTGSLKPFLVPGPIHLDAGLPDGQHCYRVAAMDLAGNLSHDSNEICVFLDNRAPKAVLVDPEDGARFDAARRLLALSEDLDVSTVAFEYQRVGEGFWTAIAADGDAPFEILWDIGGLGFGEYRLRAVATDAGTRSDPSPGEIAVTLGDATPPDVPAGLTARARGGDVLLNWQAAGASDLRGYRVYRGETLALETGSASATDGALGDGLYEYRVSAIDLEDNESARSEGVSARIYAPVLLPSYPVFDTAVVDLGGENAEAGATVRLFASGASIELAQTVADAEGGFTFSSAGLPLGVNLLVAEATDAGLNVSRRSAEILLVRNERPAQPSGFSAVANGDVADLSWDASAEGDLSGYLVTRDSEILNARGPVLGGVTAAASKNPSAARNVIDGLSTSWNIGSQEEQWIELRLAMPRHVEEIRLVWAPQFAASDYDLLIEIEGRLAPVARVRGNTEVSLSVHGLAIPVRTARVRLHIYSGVHSSGVFLREFQLFEILPATGTAFSDEPSERGFYDYAVSALDVLGGRSGDAGPVRLAVGDVTPPDPPVSLVATANGTGVVLEWSAPSAQDLARYRVYRDGALIGESFSASYADQNLRNGSYSYHVVSVDEAGNESVPSNTASATVAVAPPSAPILTLSVVPAGEALSLSWTEAFGPLAVAEYSVLRGGVSGGPYAEAARVSGLSFLDSGLTNGIEVFYVVRAADLRGEPSSDSNEVSGIPDDSEAPPAPILFSPEGTVASSRFIAVGAAEPSSLVSVHREGVRLGSVQASDVFADVAELSLGTSGNVTGRFALSFDRKLAAEVVFDEVRLYSLGTGQVRSVPYTGASSFARGVAFSPSGGKLAVATTAGFDVNGALRILDLASETTEVLAMTGPPQAPAWISEEEVAVGVGEEVQVIEVATGSARTLHTSASGFPPERLVASDGGQYLAWSERGEELFVVPSAGGAPALVVDDFNLSGFVWAGPRTLAFSRFDSGLHFYDVDSGSPAGVAGTEGMTNLASLGPEGAVSAMRAQSLFWILPGGLVMELGEKPARLDLELLAWSSDLHFVGTTHALSLLTVEPPGRFALEVRLVPGLNRLAARAADARGNESPDSEAVVVSFENASLPDLIVAGAPGIVPSAPVSGENASVSVTIRNAGSSPSEATVVSVTGIDEGGSLYAVGTRAVPALVPGASVTVSLLWTTAGKLGPQILAATVDPLSLVDESNEENNTASSPATVVGTETLALSISLGRGTYGARETAEITISAVNGGPAQNFVLETVIEDGAGAPVAIVDSRSATLGYAESLRYAVFWNTGPVLAGNYVARVRALEATATSPFAIARTLDVELGAASERPVYREGDAVGLLARISNGQSNAPLRALSLRYRVFGPGNPLLFETSQPLGYLAIGGSTASRAVWQSGALDPGVYRATVEALDEGVLVAATETSFEMAPLASVSLRGSLTLGRSGVAAGEELTVGYTIENESVIALANGTVRAELMDPAAGPAVASAEGALSIDASSSATGELRISTSGLSLGAYTVVLSAETSSLATAEVVLFAAPSAPSLNAPAMGASSPQRLTLSVNNATNPNAQTLTYDFEIYLDPSLQFRIGAASGLPEGANTTSWAVPLSLEENRSYFWRARGSDRFAASDWMGPAEVFVDSRNDAPEPPTLFEPAESSEVGVLRPSLVVGNALDLDSDLLTYTFELYRGADLVAAVSGVSEGSASTSFTPAFDLGEDETYFWRARANDGELDSDWMPLASFRVNTGNQPPPPPVLVAPKSTKVGTLRPELVALASRDPENDPVTHTVQIDASDRFDTTALQESPPLTAGGAELRFTTEVALEENGVYFWRARATDGFAVSAWSETAAFQVDVANAPPGAPAPQRPMGGALVESTTPALAVINAADPEGDRLRYSFEVYEDPGLASLAARVTALAEGSGETAWVVSPRLEDGRTYYWMAFASDGTSDGAPSRVESFRVSLMNEAPSAPSLVSPPSGGIVSGPATTLLVENATDADLDPLTYQFEIYRDEPLTLLVETFDGVPEGIGETAVTVSAALVENQVYYWRARAFDGALFGSWISTARFRFSAENEPPGSPLPVEPSDDAVVGDPQPVLVVANSIDPEGDAIFYVFEVLRDGVPAAESPPIGEGAAGRTSWHVEPALEENGAYQWRVYALDGALSSAPSAAFRLTVDALEEPPAAPILVSPVDGATVATAAPLLVVENATSPDGPRAGPLVYHFALYRDQTLVAEDVSVPEGNVTTTWEVPVTLVPGALYSWSARAVDSRGLASDWAPSFQFTVEPKVSECPPEWMENFERYATGTAPAGWQLESEVLNPYFRVKKTGGSRRLVSAESGQGAFLFAGNGEAFGWRNYELRGELRLEESEGCAYRTGVTFYARPKDGASYRLELTGLDCHQPKARVVKVTRHVARVLGSVALDREDDDERVRFEIETLNHPQSTSIRARLEIDDDDYFLDVEDAEAPLRSGTLGVWASFAEAAWDDLHVREVDGFSSGISGDADGDGLCDGEAECEAPLEVCLDEGYDPVTGLSPAVVARYGGTNHHGPTACGAQNSYSVRARTGALVVRTPAIAGGSYRLRLLVRRGSDRKISVVLPDGSEAQVRSSSDDDDDEGPFVWSEEIEASLGPGVHEFRIRSIANATVHVEAYRLESCCR